MNEITPKRGRLLSFRQALVYLGMEEPRLRRLVERRKIPVHRDGRLGFWTADLDEWILAHRTPAVDERPTPAVELPRPERHPHDIRDLMPKKRRLLAEAS